MENISKEEKKKLFYALMKQCPDGLRIGSYHQEPGDAMYEAGYWNYNWKIKNNGILGIQYGGKDEEGKKTVILMIGGALGEAIHTGILHRENLAKSFDDDSQLDEFLDRFFDMNNMEAINEFAPYSEEFTEYEEYHRSGNDFPLEYLYMLDCLNDEFGEALKERHIFRSRYSGEDPNITFGIDLSRNTDSIIVGISERKADDFKRKQTLAKFNYYAEPGKPHSSELNITLDEIQDPNKTDRIIEMCQKAITDFPKVYQALRTGTYSKTNESPLKKREADLSALENEAKLISETERLVKTKEGKDIPEAGEE